MKTAYLFPGQGAQHVGMGKDICENFPVAMEIMDRCEEATSMPLKKLCFTGPDEVLAQTDNCQPAIFAVSMATLAALKQFDDTDSFQEANFMAGLSLGEYSALHAAGAMGLETAVKLVAKRGELMQSAALATDSSMLCVMGLEEPQAVELCQAASEGEIITCANFNCPGQIVLSGQSAACKRAANLAEKFGASRAIELNVAGAFHSEIMQPAADGLGQTLELIELSEPAVPVMANVDANPHGSVDTIKHKPLDQLVSPIRWQGCMEWLLDAGVEKYYEIGPGRVLSGLMRRIKRKTDFTCVNSASVIKKLFAKS